MYSFSCVKLYDNKAVFIRSSSVRQRHSVSWQKKLREKWEAYIQDSTEAYRLREG